MKPKVREIHARSILSRSGIPGMKYCINPYTGCTHACTYCYATFMKRFTGHSEPWGTFTDIKINAPEILRKQLKRAEKGSVMLSSVTDPYQPAETRYKITRKCLEVLELFQFPVKILTKSPLIVRDIDIISKLQDTEVGLTITTDDDRVRKIFEPNAPPISERLEALKTLYKAGIYTYVFIGPLLPMNPDALAKQIRPYAHRILIDRMNYRSKTQHIYKKHKMEKWLDEGFTEKVISKLQLHFVEKDLSVC